MGSRPGQGRALESRGAGGFADLAPGASTQHPHRKRRPHPGCGRLLREGETVDRGPGTNDSRPRGENRGSHREADVRRAALGARQKLGGLAHLAGVAAHDQHRRPGGGLYRTGGKTVLPHKAVAKIDMRLVPDMTAADTLAKLKAHLVKHGFADIEVNMSGGY